MGEFIKGKINLSKEDLQRVGVELERMKLNLKDKSFGKYGIDHLSKHEIAALYVLDGMVKYQEESNMGIEVSSPEILELYDCSKRQKEMDNIFDTVSFIRDKR